MMRYVIHRADPPCPALCRDEVNCCADSCAHDGIILPKGCDHIRHKCSCSPPSPEALAELVEAAGCVAERSVRSPSTIRLAAALKPFTKENQ